MQMGFFAWVREGVRQSVLLGVADAAEQLGIPGEDETTTREFITSLRESEPLNTIEASSSRSGGTRRRRLGRSLKDEASSASS
jgi:hypothetical protein